MKKQEELSFWKILLLTWFLAGPLDISNGKKLNKLMSYEINRNAHTLIAFIYLFIF